MRLRTVAFAAALAVFALAYVPRAEAYGFRIGGTSVVDPDVGDSAHMFSIGTDGHTMFMPWLGLNSGSTFHVNGDVLFIDGFIGLIGKIPVALGGNLKVTVRGDFLFKYGYFFEGNGLDHAIAIGGIAGPGVEYDFGGIALGFDVDVQFYKHMWVNAGTEPDDMYVAVSYLLSLHF